MHRKIANVLFVSDENQCRSLLAEACLNHLGQGQLKAFSCGVPDRVAGAPFGWTLLALQTADIPAGNLRCKSWMEFMRSGAPKMDFVVALDQDTLQLHPPWPGQPATALWNYPHVEAGAASRHKVGTSAVQTLLSLRRRIELLICLHARGKSRADIQHDLQDLAHV